MTSIESTATSAAPIGPAIAGRGPLVLLRLEGLAVLIASVFAYGHGHHSWILFAALLLTPDVSFAGYVAGPHIGAICYNILHTYVSALLLGAIFLASGISTAIPLIWIAHIGMDRCMGYGLKYPTGFGDTHLGKIGR
jgi:hypothetical protein